MSQGVRAQSSVPFTRFITTLKSQTVTLNLFQGPSISYTLTVRQEKQPCVYILASKHYGTLYVGATSDLMKRLYQHRNDLAPGHTAKYAIHRLVHFEMFEDMTAAIVREKQLKNWRRQWKINLIESENPHWGDLAVGLGLPPIRQSKSTDGP